MAVPAYLFVEQVSSQTVSSIKADRLFGMCDLEA